MTRALVIGAGPAGLMAANVLARAGHAVLVADAMPSVGRKFLMAGKSGLNLTKDEPADAFLARYGDCPPLLAKAIADFGPQEVMAWAQDLGQSVFVGSTGRVFPEVMKASPLLRAWLAQLRELGVSFETRWRWSGWDKGASLFHTPDGPQYVNPDATVIAMGGASWKRLGSDGAWSGHLGDVAPFQPANCGFHVNWTDHMSRFFGQPIKSTRLTAGAATSRGEWVLTERGIEGGGIYEVSAAVRSGAPLVLDLLPDVTIAALNSRLSNANPKATLTQKLRKVLRLPAEKIALVHECAARPLNTPEQIVGAVKGLPIKHAGPLPLDEAISTAGGLRFAALTDGFMIRDRPGVFAAGEMLDWEAPTGGYLITACLASGRAAGHGAATWLDSRVAAAEP